MGKSAKNLIARAHICTQICQIWPNMPNMIFGAHIYIIMMLKIVLVAHLAYEKQWGKLRNKIQTFVSFWDTLVFMCVCV